MVKIGIYDENKTLVGYKADTFWSVTKLKEHAKPHNLVPGWNTIPDNLIVNLQHILSQNEEETQTLIHILAEEPRNFLKIVKNFFVGYESDDSATPTFTHQVIDGIVTELH
jgi:hypothetical protein